MATQRSITTAETFRRLTIAKEMQVRVQTEIVRGERIPRQDVESVYTLVFQAIRGVIKASKLPIESWNEIFDSLRAAAQGGAADRQRSWYGQRTISRLTPARP
jgi:hypothetical protein